MRKLVLFLIAISLVIFITVTCDKKSTTEPGSNQNDGTPATAQNDFIVEVEYKTEQVTLVLFSGSSANVIWQTITEYDQNFECKAGETNNSITIDVLDEDEVTVTWEKHDIVFDCRAYGSSYSRTWYSQNWTCDSYYGCYFDVGTIKETMTISITLIGSMPPPKKAGYLTNLTLSSGSLNTTFSPWDTYYSAVVNINVPSITVKPTAYDSAASIKVNGIPCISGMQSQKINL